MSVLDKDSVDIVPTAEAIQAASEAKLFNEKGAKVTFGSLVADQKTVVVFIRHFFCGFCQAYVSQLAQVPQQAFDDANTKLIVIGCGDPKLITDYKANLNFKHPVYADPTRELYKKLGMTFKTLNGTPSGQKKRSYAQGKARIMLSSLTRIGNPFNLGKQGKLSQLGGDFVFGPGNTCTFAHRMLHIEDHVEVEDLMKEAGVQYSPSS